MARRPRILANRDIVYRRLRMGLFMRANIPAMSEFRPKFDSIFSGPWPFEKARGVGLRFDGKPSNAAAFLTVLAEYGCPRDIAYRVTEDLCGFGVRRTTVLAHLDFDALAVELKPLGVTLEIVPPQGYRAPQ